MNAVETRAELIDLALQAAGWGIADGSRVRREVITPGRLQGGSKRATQDLADYVLISTGQKLAVVEAERRGSADTESLAHAKSYAEWLQTRFACSTSGVRIYRVRMIISQSGQF